MILIVYILIVMNLAAFAVAVRLAYSQKRAKICLPHFYFQLQVAKSGRMTYMAVKYDTIGTS